MPDRSILTAFAARLRQFMASGSLPPAPGSEAVNATFNTLALELFALQHQFIPVYRKLCEARRVSPASVSHWTQIPVVPTSAFKELELTSLLAAERLGVFHSSGTTGQQPSRHFHSPESLAVYEASLLPWFKAHALSDATTLDGLILTPTASQAPHSSLVHMFQSVLPLFGVSSFCGNVDSEGAWTLDLSAAVVAMDAATNRGRPLLVMGTAFNFVHLLDHLAGLGRNFRLPGGSRVLETGGYKGRSRSLPKAELHALIGERLRVPAARIICEYGMSELSSQAYDNPQASAGSRIFHFPPWARVRIVSPETGAEVADGETGLVQVFDLANVWSVLAVQTGDLAIRRGAGFELLGRAAEAEPRGCSLMAV